MYLDDIGLNRQIKIEPVVINKEKMISFARDYDPIPLHIDEDFAEKTCFGKLIAPGVMSFLTVWAKYVEVDFAGEQLIAGKSMKIEWIKPVFAEDVLVGKATVTKILPRNKYNGILEITIDVYNQNDELVLQNITESIVERNPLLEI